MKLTFILPFFAIILAIANGSSDCRRLPRRKVVALFNDYVAKTLECNQGGAKLDALLDMHAKNLVLYTDNERLVGRKAIKFLRFACNQIVGSHSFENVVSKKKIIGNLVVYRSRLLIKGDGDGVLEELEFSEMVFWCGDKVTVSMLTVDSNAEED